MSFRIITATLLALALSACGEQSVEQETASQSADTSQSAEAREPQAQTLTVYKSPTCGCCEDWIVHLEEKGFQTTAEHPDDMRTKKTELNIAPQYGSCHTGVSESGYVFEGHVPAKLVQQFLDNPPENALGLAVPRMPVGSPGMEMGDRFDPYDVLLLKTDGSSEVYARIEQPEQQY
ncbi:DUF411 domain-containing protein [Marinimicrobium sp. C2-29]|uniref:DUF411 domain-containing protein n=1 Tax=Marinimicrobium sp. C2-29 TaxID=3139825 RepID=UPI003139C10E